PLRPIAEGHVAAVGCSVSGARQIEDLVLITAPLVITSSYLAPDLHSATWLSDREVDHVQVVLGESAVEITGLVRPGRTPCTVCSCLHRKDADSGWFEQYPRLRALSDREALTDPLARVLGAGHAVQLLRHALLRPQFDPVCRVIALDAETVGEDELAFHDRCHCRAPVPDFGSVGEQAQ